MKCLLFILFAVILTGCGEEVFVTEPLQGDYHIKKPQNSSSRGYDVSLGVKGDDGEFKELVMDVNSEVYIKKDHALLIGLMSVDNNKMIKRLYICNSKDFSKLDVTDLITDGYRGRYNFKDNKSIKELRIDEEDKFIVFYDGKTKRDFPEITVDWKTLRKIMKNPKPAKSK